jgi:hypothetical protein
MHLPRPAHPTYFMLLAALVFCFGFGMGPLLASGEQATPPATSPVPHAPETPPHPDDDTWALGEAFSALDIGAIVDEAIRAATLAFETADIERTIRQALADARVEEQVARALRDVDVAKMQSDLQKMRGDLQRALADIDTARIQKEIDEALAKEDLDRHVHQALEHARHELNSEQLQKRIDDAIAGIDIDAIIREATEAARKAAEAADKAAGAHPRSPK